MAGLPINHRVRALLLTTRGTLLLLKRVRNGRRPYYVTPGGGVEAHDGSFQDALARELDEEMGAEADILQEVFITEYSGSGALTGYWVQQHYFLCRLRTYDLTRRSGPEFQDPSKGEYIPEEFTIGAGYLDAITLDPPELKDFLQQELPKLVL